MKALYEYFKDELTVEAPTSTRSAVELAEFQEDAVKKARKILSCYDGVMIADSVGLGKTWIGKKLLEDFAYHLRQKAVVVCPASLREMWERELTNATISAAVLSQEELGREEFDPSPWADADVVLSDEPEKSRISGIVNKGRMDDANQVLSIIFQVMTAKATIAPTSSAGTRHSRIMGCLLLSLVRDPLVSQASEDLLGETLRIIRLLKEPLPNGLLAGSALVHALKQLSH
jgi:hypothetical protein